jgi:hypothetical protein
MKTGQKNSVDLQISSRLQRNIRNIKAYNKNDAGQGRDAAAGETI